VAYLSKQAHQGQWLKSWAAGGHSSIVVLMMRVCVQDVLTGEAWAGDELFVDIQME
jgi:hypothetical protein